MHNTNLVFVPAIRLVMDIYPFTTWDHFEIQQEGPVANGHLKWTGELHPYYHIISIFDSECHMM